MVAVRKLSVLFTAAFGPRSKMSGGPSPELSSRIYSTFSSPPIYSMGGKKKGEQERGLCAFGVSCTSETSARVREVERG